jgi:serine/threonine protein kinase
MSGTHLIGTKVGEYEVIRRVGLGGMGAVYEGRHPLIGKRVAIKVLLPQFSEDEAQMKRFLAEARAVNEIRHRGIVDIFAFGELEGGSRYFVMEFLEGASFEQLLKSRRSLPAAEALTLMEEVLDAVAAAHQAGIVHRDIKPSNLFLVDIGRGRPFVKLLDFGLAKLTSDESGGERQEATGIVGTPKYMSPEQVNGLKAGPEADIYALGVVLFELIAGKPPFVASSPVELMTRHLDARPPRLSEVAPGTPADLERLVERMLAKRPQDRPGDAEALRSEVARLRSRLDVPLRRGMSPQQRAALEDDVGPTMVRVVRRGEPQPDITPIQSRSVGRVDPERTMVGNENSLPWGSTTLDTGDSDSDLGSRRTQLEEAVPRAAPTAPSGLPTMPSRPEERPVPTVPFDVDSLPVPTLPPDYPSRPPPPVERALGKAAALPSARPLPLPRPVSGAGPSAPPRPRATSQSSPTLSATEAADGSSLPPLPVRDGPATDRQESEEFAGALAEARDARAEAAEQHRLGGVVLMVGLGLGAALFVLIGVLLALR